MIRARTACRFAGVNYKAGDTVPESAIDRKRIQALIDMRIIEIVPDPPSKIHFKPLPKKKKKKAAEGDDEFIAEGDGE